MIYTFDYEETLSRRIKIEAKDLSTALTELVRRIDTQEIVLNADDFLTGQISAPLYENKYTLGIENCGDPIDSDKGDWSVVLETW